MGTCGVSFYHLFSGNKVIEVSKGSWAVYAFFVLIVKGKWSDLEKSDIDLFYPELYTLKNSLEGKFVNANNNGVIHL